MDGPMIYQIRVQGRLDESWSDWLAGMVIAFEGRSHGSDVTTITGRVVDQSFRIRPSPRHPLLVLLVLQPYLAGLVIL